MKYCDLNYNKIVSISLIFVGIILTLISCSKFNYITKNFNTTIVIDSVQAMVEMPEERIEKDSNGIYIGNTYSKDSVLISTVKYEDTIKYVRTGESRNWFEDGKIKSILNYNNGFLDGKLLTYYPNGKIRREDLYKNDSLISGKCYDSLGKEIKYFKYDIDPEVDLKQFQNCLIFPENLRRQDIQERLIFKILISKKGGIVKIEYDSSHSKEFVDEACRCILKTKFTPAYIDREAISCWVHIPITFQLR